MAPFCLEQGVGCIPWSPLARGFLAGNRTQRSEDVTTRSKLDTFADSMYFTDNDFQILDRVRSVAADHGVKPIQVALGWIPQKPTVASPIIGASKVGYVDDAVAALDITLTSDEVEQIDYWKDTDFDGTEW